MWAIRDGGTPGMGALGDGGMGMGALGDGAWCGTGRVSRIRLSALGVTTILFEDLSPNPFHRLRLFAGVTYPRALLLLSLLGALVAPAGADETIEFSNAATRIRGEFDRLDVDRDRRLRLDEFLRREGERAELKRDFHLYDLDLSGRLTRSEFASVSGVIAPSLRGKMPDPFDDLVADAVAALDESYDRWQERPQELVNAHTFVANFIGSISPGGKRYVTGRILRQADRNNDGQLSRAEARHFLQQQLGVSRLDGPLLREPTGRLVRFDRFLAWDKDQSGGLSREEFAAGGGGGQSPEEEFSVNDRDESGVISYSEYADPTGPNYFDPVEWFRGADSNLDAHLDADELADASDDTRRHLVSSTFAGFDYDDDGRLSLREYRLSMHANVNYPWQTRPVDRDRDGRLSYDEFVFHTVDLFQLQRRFYFHRLDRDGDGSLAPGEFDFITQQPISIRLQSVSSAECREVYQSREYPDCGWPSVSPDARQVLFHRCPPSGCRDGRIVVMSMEGENVRELCDGIQPSWSADGKQFVCTRRSERDAIWIMNADGRSGQQVAVGRSAKWSPDGNLIAYLHDNGVWVFDVRLAKSRQIVRREDHRYQDLGDDIAWSPQNDRVAVLGNLGDSSELVMVPLQARPENKPVLRKRLSLEAVCRGSLSWNDRDGIIFARSDASLDRMQLVSVDPADGAKARIMEAFDEKFNWKSACITPDGKWYIAVSETNGVR